MTRDVTGFDGGRKTEAQAKDSRQVASGTQVRESILQSFREGTVHSWPFKLRDVLHQIYVDLLQHPEEVHVLSFLSSCSVQLEWPMSPLSCEL